MSYVYVATTIILTVYGQVIIKWQVLKAGSLPPLPTDKVIFLLKLLLNGWILSALAAALVAALAWMAAMTRMQLSQAYPLVSLSFVLVVLLSGIFFGEPLGWNKWAG